MYGDCPHGGDPQSCPPCQSLTVPKPGDFEHLDVRVSQVFAASFSSRCPDCGESIEPNDEVRMVGDEDDRTAWHRMCAEMIR